MPNLTTSHAANALVLLSEQTNDRPAALQKYIKVPDHAASNSEVESDCPIVNALYLNGASVTILKMTNFQVKQFTALYARLRNFVSKN